MMHSRPVARFAILLLASWLLSGAARAADIRVEGAYARAVPPGQPNSAVFMALTNGGDADRALVAAESDAAATAELHTHIMAEDMMQMRRVKRIELPAGERVVLQPGGLHVMLIGLGEQLAPGMEVALRLVLDDGSRIAVSAPVRRIDPIDMRKMQGGDGHAGH